VHLAPNAGVGDIAERRKVDPRDERSACSGQDYDLVRPILRNPLEGVDKIRMVPRRKGQRPAVGVELGHQHSLGVPGQL